MRSQRKGLENISLTKKEGRGGERGGELANIHLLSLSLVPCCSTGTFIHSFSLIDDDILRALKKEKKVSNS